MAHHGSHGGKIPITSIIWCVVGAALGLLWASMAAGGTNALRIENALVGIFGAFIGGEFVAAQLRSATAEPGFTVLALGLSVAGAIGMLVALAMLRKAVGPQGPHKRRNAGR
jgi:uncharacterized membrane protein YeaQ/YmgE (transglycosylase-associated protein family)